MTQNELVAVNWISAGVRCGQRWHGTRDADVYNGIPREPGR